MVNRLSAEWINRERRAVEAAVARADALESGGAKCAVSLTVQGAEVRIERPTWRKGVVSVSWEIFPF